MNLSWYADHDPANELTDPVIETGDIMERIMDEVPDDLTQIANMIRLEGDDCEAGALFRDLMNKFEDRLIREIRNGRAA